MLKQIADLEVPQLYDFDPSRSVSQPEGLRVEAQLYSQGRFMKERLYVTHVRPSLEVAKNEKGANLDDMKCFVVKDLVLFE
jgi:hypothetical protein